MEDEDGTRSNARNKPAVMQFSPLLSTREYPHILRAVSFTSIQKWKEDMAGDAAPIITGYDVIIFD